MARRQVTILSDDLDGAESKDVSTYSFALHGSTYEIDLTKKNAKKLDAALQPFIAAARKFQPTRRAGTKPARTDKEQLNAIRDWARKNGFEVSDRGRVRREVMEAYNAARS